MTKAEVVVVGAGLMGAASMLALARRGHEVIGFEARRPGHRAGSSHGSTRIVRRSYEDPIYIQMSGRALDLWQELEALAGRRLVTMTGALDYGPGHGAERLFKAFGAEGVDSELLSAASAADRWPHMRFEGQVLHHPEAGVVDPESAVAEMLRLARELGSHVEHETPVLSIEPWGTRARVRTSAGVTECRTVVVAAGPWVSGLLEDVIDLPPLRVTQQQVFHFARRVEGDTTSWPVALFDGDLLTYALPGGRDGRVKGNVKIGDHAPGRATTADTRDGRIDPQGRRRVIEHVREWWPGLDPRPVAEYTCLYTWTENEDFIVAPVGPLVVCSPCSGHGAKFALLIGQWVADIVEGRGVPYGVFGLTERR
jgi:glycine/D-amino acid oxidase-like deaminating enzyme